MIEQLGPLPTLQDCVHCGLCLPACPTYALTGREAQSPRGRISILRGFVEGNLAPTPAVEEGLEDCLVCRACESACPSGISMERLMGEYRRQTLPRRTARSQRLERWALSEIVSNPTRLTVAAALLRMAAPALRHLPLAAELPLPARLQKPHPLPGEVLPHGAPRGTVAVHRGCLADHWFRQETAAAGRVLARNGWRVVFPAAECCGALHRHAGLHEESVERARSTARGLLALHPDHIVVDSAGCAAALAEPLEGAGAQEREVGHLITNTLELLSREGWSPPRSRLRGRWMAAPPCHHRHGPLPETGTREVLGAILEQGYRELPSPEHCCGAAGFYMLRRPARSRAIGQWARERFLASEGEGVLAGNPGCLLRWESLLRDHPEKGVMHPTRALDRTYRRD